MNADRIGRHVLAQLLNTVSIVNQITRTPGNGGRIYSKGDETAPTKRFPRIPLTEDAYVSFSLTREHLESDDIRFLEELFFKPSAVTLAAILDEIAIEAFNRELLPVIETDKIEDIRDGLLLVTEHFNGVGLPVSGRSFTFAESHKAEVIKAIGLVKTPTVGAFKLGTWDNGRVYISPNTEGKHYAIHENAVVMASRRIAPYFTNAKHSYLEAGGICLLTEVDDSDSASVKVLIRILLGITVLNPNGVVVIDRPLAPKGEVLTPTLA